MTDVQQLACMCLIAGLFCLACHAAWAWQHYRVMQWLARRAYWKGHRAGWAAGHARGLIDAQWQPAAIESPPAPPTDAATPSPLG